MTARTVVIGVGSEHRGDDLAGLLAVRCAAPLLRGVEVHELDGEVGRMLDAWDGADLAIVIDAVRTGAKPGTIHRVDDAAGPGSPALGRNVGTHSLGIAEAVSLGRVLGRLPRRLVVFGIEGRAFSVGSEPHRAVVDAAHEVAGRIVVELARVA